MDTRYTRLCDSLASAWSARYQRATDVLAHATVAPSLFRPEFIDGQRAERDRAIAEHTRWLVGVEAE